MVKGKVDIWCPECDRHIDIITNVEITQYDYAEMFVDHLKGDFDLKKFIESFGRSTLLKLMGEMV